MRLAALSRRVLGEPGEITGVPSQLRCDAVIRMAADGEGKDHQLRFGAANQCDECFSRRFIVRQVRIAHSSVEPERDAKRLGGAVCFCGAGCRVAARAHFALREIDNPNAVPGARRFRQRATARELDIVSMRCDC